MKVFMIVWYGGGLTECTRQRSNTCWSAPRCDVSRRWLWVTSGH